MTFNVITIEDRQAIGSAAVVGSPLNVVSDVRFNILAAGKRGGGATLHRKEQAWKEKRSHSIVI